MGHYDDHYEAVAEAQRRARREALDKVLSLLEEARRALPFHLPDPHRPTEVALAVHLTSAAALAAALRG